MMDSSSAVLSVFWRGGYLHTQPSPRHFNRPLQWIMLCVIYPNESLVLERIGVEAAPSVRSVVTPGHAWIYKYVLCILLSMLVWLAKWLTRGGSLPVLLHTYSESAVVAPSRILQMIQK